MSGYPVITPTLILFLPAGKELCRLQTAGKEDVDRAVRSAKEAFKTWSQLTGGERGKLMRQVARLVSVSTYYDLMYKKLNIFLMIEETFGT